MESVSKQEYMRVLSELDLLSNKFVALEQENHKLLGDLQQVTAEKAHQCDELSERVRQLEAIVQSLRQQGPSLHDSPKEPRLSLLALRPVHRPAAIQARSLNSSRDHIRSKSPARCSLWEVKLQLGYMIRMNSRLLYTTAAGLQLQMWDNHGRTAIRPNSTRASSPSPTSNAHNFMYIYPIHVP